MSTKDTTKQPLIAKKAVPLPDDSDLELGEYLLHVYIQETQGLKLDDIIEGMLKIEAFGKVFYSKVHPNVTPGNRLFWGEHFFVDLKFDSRTSLENASFNLSIYDHNLLFADALIGETSFACSRVYASPEHTIFDRWAVLTNSQREICCPMGFIKYSVNFVKAGFNRTNLERDYDPSSQKNTLQNLDLPPEILMKQKQIIVHLFKGARIAKMDSMGEGADPYVKINMGGLKIKTQPKKDQLEPVFSEKILIPSIYPTVVDRLMISFKDYDTIGKNEHIGCKSILLADIENGRYAFPTWQYFYGAHEDADDKDYKKQMNTIPEIASWFKGALLLAIEMIDVESPSFTTTKMSGDEYNMIEEAVQTVEFKTSIFLEYIQNLLSKTEDHYVSLYWGGKQVWSQKIKYSRGVLIINQEIEISESFGVPKRFLDDFNEIGDEESVNRLMQLIPDVIMSVVCDDKHIVFYRIKPHRFIIQREDEAISQEIKLHADQSVSDLMENQAGIISFKISSGLVSQFRNHTPMWVGNHQLARKAFKPIWLVFNLFQGKDLLPSDDSGVSDPCVQFYHFGSTKQSAVFPKTLNPVWNQRVFMKSYMIGDSIPAMVMNVWDKDEDWKGSRKFDFLGYSLVNIDPANIVNDNFSSLGNPTWNELCLGKGNKCGKILMSYQIITQNNFQRYNQFMTTTPRYWRLPVTKSRHHIKLNILGLRGLESTGLLPIKSAGVNIATSSLIAVENMGNGAVFTDLVANAKTSGANPSIGTVLTLSVDIPTDIKIMPIISCTVQEMGFRLFSQNSTIGTFSINLGLFTLMTKQNIIKKLSNLSGKLIAEDDTEGAERVDELVNEIQKSIDVYGKPVEAIDYQNDGDEAQPNEKEEELDVGLFGDVEEDEEEEEEEETVKNAGNHGMGRVFNKKIIHKSKSRHAASENNMDNEFLASLGNIKKKNISRQRLTTLKALPSFKEEDEGPDTFKRTFNFNKKVAGGGGLGGGLGGLAGLDKFVEQMEFKVASETQVVFEGSDQRIRMGEVNLTNFIGLGFATEEKNEKHYRRVIDNALEDSEFMGDDIFFKLDIGRGKKINLEKKNLISRIFGSKEEKFRHVGKFRGNIEVVEEALLQKIQNLNIDPQLMDDYEIPYDAQNFKHNELDKEILRTVDVLLRVYVVDARFNESKDFNSENDSYIKIELDGKEIKDTNKIMDRDNPKFFSTFQFEHKLPGPSDIKIKFFDYDPIKSDEFIGETVIDIERRFFDRRWRSFDQHPMEKRLIFHPSSAIDVGHCRVFVEIFDKNMPIPMIRNIRPQPAMEIELRIVVWEVWDVQSQDFEDVSDLFVKVNLPSFNVSMKTDTHFRAQGGYGSFNWRVKFKLNIDEYFTPDMADLTFMIYDKDLLKSNDFVASSTINIAKLIKDTIYYNNRQKFMGLDNDGQEARDFTLETTLKNYEIVEGKDLMIPKIKVSVDCLTNQEAIISPVGVGRGDPNHDPHLEAPKGRFKWSLNPLDILEQLVGPQFKKKAMMICCSIFCILIFILIFPIFFSEMLAITVAKLFGLE